MLKTPNALKKHHSSILPLLCYAKCGWTASNLVVYFQLLTELPGYRDSVHTALSRCVVPREIRRQHGSICPSRTTSTWCCTHTHTQITHYFKLKHSWWTAIFETPVWIEKKSWLPKHVQVILCVWFILFGLRQQDRAVFLRLFSEILLNIHLYLRTVPWQLGSPLFQPGLPSSPIMQVSVE